MTISEKSIPSCKFEYTIKHWNGGNLTDSSSVIREKFLNTVNEWGQEGWEIVQFFISTNEKCLFVMAGVQGFNNNRENYYEGWEPIRSYLEGEAKKVGLTAKKTSRNMRSWNVCSLVYQKPIYSNT